MKTFAEHVNGQKLNSLAETAFSLMAGRGLNPTRFVAWLAENAARPDLADAAQNWLLAEEVGDTGPDEVANALAALRHVSRFKITDDAKFSTALHRLIGSLDQGFRIPQAQAPMAQAPIARRPENFTHHCPYCGGKITVNPAARGRTVNCLYCNRTYTVPASNLGENFTDWYLETGFYSENFQQDFGDWLGSAAAGVGNVWNNFKHGFNFGQNYRRGADQYRRQAADDGRERAAQAALQALEQLMRYGGQRQGFMNRVGEDVRVVMDALRAIRS